MNDFLEAGYAATPLLHRCVELILHALQRQNDVLRHVEIEIYLKKEHGAEGTE